MFREEGYDNVTVSDICKKSGLTRGAFYYHFETKDEILDDYFLSSDTIALKEIIPLIGSDDYIEQFYHVINVYLDRGIAAGSEVLGQILKRSMDKGLQMLIPDAIAMRSVYVSLIEKAQKSGQIKNMMPAPALVDAVVYISEGISLVWCNKKGDMDIKTEHKRLLDALFMRE